MFSWGYFGDESNTFSTFKTKHIHFEQWRVHFEELKTDGQAGATAAIKGSFNIITIRLISKYTFKGMLESLW